MRLRFLPKVVVATATVAAEMAAKASVAVTNCWPRGVVILPDNDPYFLIRF